MSSTTAALVERARLRREDVDARRLDLECRIAALQGELDALPEADATLGLRTIADEVAALLPDLEVDLLGPQGLDCLMSIHARRSGRLVAWLVFRPVDDGYRLVDDGVDTGEYAPGTAGQRAGMNHPDVPLPPLVSDLADSLRAQAMSKAA